MKRVSYRVSIKREGGGGEGIKQEKKEEDKQEKESPAQKERKKDEGIMRGQAGSQKNRAGDGARFVGEGPGGRVRDQRISFPLGLGSNHSNRKPCPALATTTIHRTYKMHSFVSAEQKNIKLKYKSCCLKRVCVESYMLTNSH